jgi:hypothetical protein
MALGDPPQKDTPVSENQRKRIGRSLDLGPDLTRAVLEPAGDGIVSSHLPHGHLGGAGPLDRPPADQPVDLTRGVVVDLSEPESFKPARGSCAEVSERIPAIDDHRPTAIEHLRPLWGQALERDAHGTREMPFLVLLLRKGFDQLRAVGQKPVQLL